MDQAFGGDHDVIVPDTDILAEFQVAWVNKNVEKNGTAQAVKAYLNYLYSPAAQHIIAGFYYRVNDTQMMNANKSNFPPTRLFSVEDIFGGWQSAMTTHFERGGELDQLLAAGHL